MKDIFVARQAIYNDRLGIYAYELLYRSGLDNRAQFPDALSATTQVLLNSFMEIGIDALVGRYRAFINLPQSFFTETPPIPFGTERIVLELLEDLDVNPQLIKSVLTLKKQGYTIAIDDYLFEGKWEPLLDVVDIVKVEVSGLTAAELSSRIGQLKQHKLTLLAEKVETHEMFELCRELGFDLFQGFFFSKPNIVQGRKLDDNHLMVLKLLQQINEPRAEIRDIEKLLSQDAGLSYKILRYVNSAAAGLPCKVDSLHRAIVLVGLQKIRTWASLMAMSGITNKPSALLVNALIRALMCEALARESRSFNPDMAFTVGLFSMLDVLLDQPMAVALEQLPLVEDVKQAICQQTGLAGGSLKCTIAFEHNDWQQMNFQGLDDAKVQEIYWSVIDRVEKSELLIE